MSTVLIRSLHAYHALSNQCKRVNPPINPPEGQTSKLPVYHSSSILFTVASPEQLTYCRTLARVAAVRSCVSLPCTIGWLYIAGMRFFRNLKLPVIPVDSSLRLALMLPTSASYSNSFSSDKCELHTHIAKLGVIGVGGVNGGRR